MTASPRVRGHGDAAHLVPTTHRSTTVQAATSDDTGVLSIGTAFDDELRQDISSAAWLMASVTVPGLALLAFLL